MASKGARSTIFSAITPDLQLPYRNRTTDPTRIARNFSTLPAPGATCPRGPCQAVISQQGDSVVARLHLAVIHVNFYGVVSAAAWRDGYHGVVVGQFIAVDERTARRRKSQVEVRAVRVADAGHNVVRATGQPEGPLIRPAVIELAHDVVDERISVVLVILMVRLQLFVHEVDMVFQASAEPSGQRQCQRRGPALFQEPTAQRAKRTMPRQRLATGASRYIGGVTPKLATPERTSGYWSDAMSIMPASASSVAPKAPMMPLLLNWPTISLASP